MNEKRILQRRIKIFQIIIFSYYLFPNLTVHAFGLTPLLNGAKDPIFSGWYPGLDWENSRRDYWFIYLYQYLGIFLTANLNVTIDSYYCFVMHMLSAQINIFRKRLSSIRMTEVDDEVIPIEQVRSNLVQQINDHQRLNSLFELIQRNLQWAYFGQVILSGIVICSVVKELAKVKFQIHYKSLSIVFLMDLFSNFISRHRFPKTQLYLCQFYSVFLHF